MPDILTTITRLHAAAVDESKTSDRVKTAAKQLSDYVIDLFSDDVLTEVTIWDTIPSGLLPRNYAIGMQPFPSGVTKMFIAKYDQTHANWLPVYFSRVTALNFAQDVATGWLDEVSKWLEERAVTATVFAEEVEKKGKKND